MSVKTLIIGASLKEARYSNKAIKKLRDFKHPVNAIGLREGLVLDVAIKRGKPAFEDIHTVSLYINPKRQPEYYNYIIGLKPRRVIFNPGTENSEFFNLLEKSSIPFETSCTLVLLATNQYVNTEQSK
ncbi:CoA-binding protein [Aquimarina agarivorans]|uniref:CoA-binding protein n=1 Tax=Aquimarina agarivorans TaxID=980584 RepID=UPI000248E82F|nr:CoA-binding protein [Aquimarina agarivorans]